MSAEIATSNGYTLQYFKNFRSRMYHFHIKETCSYVGVPENEQVNINVTANGILEVTYYSGTDRKDIETLPEDKLVKMFTSNKDVHGKYHLCREGRNQDEPTKPLLCTIINDSLITANKHSGKINIDPLFADTATNENTNRH